MGPPRFLGDFFRFGVWWLLGCSGERLWDWLVVIGCENTKFVGKSISCVESPIYSEFRSI
jgi:hypothetical protein